jgi:hypothetical protein
VLNDSTLLDLGIVPFLPRGTVWSNGSAYGSVRLPIAGAIAAQLLLPLPDRRASMPNQG